MKKLSLILRLTLVSLALYSINTLHSRELQESIVLGVPPEFTSWTIEAKPDIPTQEIYGSINPPTLVVNGIQVKLKESAAQSSGFKVIINDQFVATRESSGSFYLNLTKVKESTQIEIFNKNKKYSYKLNNKKYFFEEQLSETIVTKNKIDNFFWEGHLPKDQKLFVNNKKINSIKGSVVKVPIALKSNQTVKSFKIIDNKTYKVVSSKITVKKEVYTKDSPYLVFDKNQTQLKFNKNKFSFNVSENTDVIFMGQKLKSKNQKIEFTFINDCSRELKEELLTVKKENKEITKVIQLDNSICDLFFKKNKSRFSIAVGFGHVGHIDSQASNFDIMYSRHIGLGPRLSLSFRVYDKLFLDVRGFKTQAFHNSDGEYSEGVGGGFFSLGYPYRGKYFTQIGVMNMNVISYRNRKIPNFYGLDNSKVTGIGVELGRRWHLSPSWSLSSKTFFTLPFMSFNSEPTRRWTFFIIEPLVLEFYFL